MRSRVLSIALISATVLTACGGATNPVRSQQVREALTSNPELLEFESLTTRQELFREMARVSQSESGQLAQPLVLFPISVNGNLIAAPGFDARTDLLLTPDAGSMQLSFDGISESWSEDRRDSLQGLSEREAAELVARTLLSRWSIAPSVTVAVDRATGAPYAAAYVDGILRINPSFLYLAVAAAPSSAPASVQ
jgi:hypothetical protein